MANVQGRKLVIFNTVTKTLCAFYSRIVLRKLNSDVLNVFRTIEKLSKRNLKLNADLRFLIVLLITNVSKY